MDTNTVIVIAVVVVAIVIVAAILIVKARERKHLKQQFGSEYDRAVVEHGDARKAEVVLLEREKRVKKFTLRPLTPSDRERYAEDWAAIQRRRALPYAPLPSTISRRAMRSAFAFTAMPAAVNLPTPWRRRCAKMPPRSTSSSRKRGQCRRKTGPLWKI